MRASLWNWNKKQRWKIEEGGEILSKSKDKNIVAETDENLILFFYISPSTSCMIASWFWEPKLLLFHCSAILKMWLPLLVEDCCLSSWHHICVNTSRKRRNKKWGYLCFYSRSIPEAILNFYSHSVGPKIVTPAPKEAENYSL